MKKFCREDCNNCFLVRDENSRQITLLLNILHKKFGDEVRDIMNKVCPNMTVCYDCDIDDFTHNDDCEIMQEVSKAFDM